MKRWLISMMLLAAGCGVAPRELAHSIILPEQRTIAVREPEQLPAIPIPPNVSPRTVSNPRPDLEDWNLSLDDAIRIGLERTRVVRVVTGLTATASGQTIYDAAINNTTIDQAQAAFDPKLTFNNQWYRNNVPFALLAPPDQTRAVITSSPASAYLGSLGLSQTNVLGGQASATWTENPTHFGGAFNPSLGINGVPLNPQDTRSVNLGYTQPLLQGGGFRVNMAPVVIARLNTEVSFFQYKDSVQEMVRGIIEAYWNLVNARTDAWAKRIQVQLSEAAYLREQARLDAGLADAKDVAQARVTYTQFKANLVASNANVLVREGLLRNILGLPPADDKFIIPVSPPTTDRLRPEWAKLVEIAEMTRPDIIELKIIIEAEQQRLLQAENQMLPQLNAFANYQFNGLTGIMPNNDSISTSPGVYQNWTLGVNFSVPLGLRQGRALVRQEKLLIEKDRANLQQGLHQAIHELTQTVRDLDSAFEQYLAYKDARAAAEINVKVQSEKFKAGQSIYLNVLQALNDWGTAVTSEVQALTNYNVALATLERRTGTILQTHGLIFHEERMRTLGPFGFRRTYPAAQPPVGNSQNYPAGAGPAENSFNLVSPVPTFKGPPPQLLPPVN
ncbi:MAG TPA: TolC family protein [Gemmataceae bacterium]|nr:TolC family protein [Gemmataceae bacterium]